MRCFAQLGTICTILKETLACNFTKSNAPSWVLSTFLKLLNGTKQRNASHMYSQFLVEGGGATKQDGGRRFKLKSQIRGVIIN